MSKEVIYIDVKDDVTSIIDKIKKTEHKIVALVPPKQIGILQSAVNLQLLAHAAKQAKKVMVIITNQEALIRLSAVAKIPVAKTLTSKPEMPEIPALKIDGDDDIIDGAQLSVGELAGMSKEEIEAPSGDAKAKTPFDKLAPVKIKVPNYDKFRKKIFIGGLALLVLGGFLVWAIIFAPRAEITLITNTKGVNISSSISFVEQADQTKFETNLIYAQTQKSNRKRSHEFEVTGTKDLKIPAGGTITLLNSNLGAKTIPAGTSFSAGGCVYTSQEAVNVPAPSGASLSDAVPGKATVTVKSTKPGPSCNADARKYSIQGVAHIEALGSAMTGGSERTIRVMTQADYDKAKTELLKDGHDSAVKELRNKFDSSMVIIKDSLITKEGELVSNVKVDEEAKDGKVKLEQIVEYQISAVPKKTLEEYIGYIALKDNKSDKTKLKVYNSGVDQVVFNDFVFKDGKGSMRVSAQAQIGPDIDKEQVKEEARGKALGDVQSHYTSIEGIKDVEIKLSPFWVKSVPGNKDKITVFVKN